MGPFDRLSGDARSRLRASPPPDWVAPMLATLTDRYFSDPAWIFERKLDGERCLAFRRGGEVRLLSRSQQHLDNTYPEIVDGLAGPGTADVVVDGEVVAFEGNRTSFERLQQRLGITDAAQARRSPVPVFYYIFDLLYLDGLRHHCSWPPGPEDAAERSPALPGRLALYAAPKRVRRGLLPVRLRPRLGGTGGQAG